MHHIWGAADQRARLGPPPKPAHPPVQPGRSPQPEAGRTCAGKGLPPRWAPSACSVPPHHGPLGPTSAPGCLQPGLGAGVERLRQTSREDCIGCPGRLGPPQPDPASHTAARCSGQGSRSWAEARPRGSWKIFLFSSVILKSKACSKTERETVRHTWCDFFFLWGSQARETPVRS